MNIATAVVLYPIVRRLSERLALGYVTARIMESAFILVGLLSIISVVSVSDALAGASGAEATALTAKGGVLVSIYDWAFLFGPGLVVGFGNGLMLGYLMYRSGLVPRRMAMLGLIGGPMLILLHIHPVRGLRERVRARVPAGIAGNRVGSLAWHLRGMEGAQAEPDHEDCGSPRRVDATKYGESLTIHGGDFVAIDRTEEGVPFQARRPSRFNGKCILSEPGRRLSVANHCTANSRVSVCGTGSASL